MSLAKVSKTERGRRESGLNRWAVSLLLGDIGGDLLNTIHESTRK